jgi:ribosomal peptide maturation radical SAM protein 1
MIYISWKMLRFCQHKLLRELKVTEILLVATPYAAIERPVISISQLKQDLLGAGLDTKCIYLTFRFAELIGIRRYCALAQYTNPAELVGEYTFAKAAFPEMPSDEEAFAKQIYKPSYGHDFVFSEYFSCPNPESLAIELRRIRLIAGQFITDEATKICASNPKIVGCTSTFEQHCASLALLREIKRLQPSIITMMGGANCEGSMGAQTAYSFPWVDIVVSGEGNKTLPKICKSLLDGDPEEAYRQAGVMTYRSKKFSPKSDAYPFALLDSIDDTPVPCFDDYFTALTSYSDRNAIYPGLTAETARGCWYGSINHCTFCGLNDTSIMFRSKSPNNAYEYLKAIRIQYGINAISLTDNILNLRYISTVFSRFFEDGIPTFFFVETKANLKERQVKEMAENGIRWIQPGIESLSTQLCRAFMKGTDRLTNVALLKFCLEEGVHVSWNMLVGAPDERDEWYEEVSKIIPLLTHLQPPTGVSKVRFDRFSPYYEKQNVFKLSLKPYWSYSYVYPLEPENLENIAYFFEPTFSCNLQIATTDTINRLKTAIQEWRARFLNQGSDERPRCQLIPGAVRDVIIDSRNGTCKYHVLTGFRRALYMACRAPTDISALHLRPELERYAPTESQVINTINWFLENALILVEEGKVLSIANFAPKRPILSNQFFPGGYVNIESQVEAPIIELTEKS